MIKIYKGFPRRIYVLFIAFYMLPFVSMATYYPGSPSLREEVRKLEFERDSLNKVFQSVQETQDHEKSCELLCRMGEISIALGDVNNLDWTLSRLSHLSSKLNDIKIDAKLKKLESEFFKLKGLYRLSLESYVNYSQLQDSIAVLKIMEEKEAMIKQSEARELEFKKEQVAQLKIYALTLGISLVVAIIFLLYAIYKRRKIEGLNVHLASLLSDYVGNYSSNLSDPNFSTKVVKEIKKDGAVKVQGLTDELVVKILDGLKSFEEEKRYLKHDCTIHDVADYINTNKTYLSKVVNVVKKKPFTSYINELRLVHAIKLLKDKEYRKYTIKAISVESGFKSKSTFNNAFKEYTGLTPSEFLKSIND